MPVKNSRISGFHKLTQKERISTLLETSTLSQDDTQNWFSGLEYSYASKLVENVVGNFTLPLGVALNFKIDNQDYVIPFVTEESSVVAAASNGAKRCLKSGGFTSEISESMLIAQIQLCDVPDMKVATEQILAAKDEIFELCNAESKTAVRLGGGCKYLETRVVTFPNQLARGTQVQVDGRVGIVERWINKTMRWRVKFSDGTIEKLRTKSLYTKFLVVHLHVDTKDAMGANLVNTMAEKCAPRLEELSNGRALLKILSNLCPGRVAKVSATFTKAEIYPKDPELGGAIAARMVEAYHFASVDPFRATTHNKGIMNAVTAVALATGQDTRAIESGAHSFAAISGKYKPLTHYSLNKSGDLVGTIEIPLAVGTVGGITKTHPQVLTNLKLLDVQNSKQLASVIAAAGLAQNFAALLALSTDGIQKGHMKMHASNLAMVAKVPDEYVDVVVQAAVASGKRINPTLIGEIWENMKRGPEFEVRAKF